MVATKIPAPACRTTAIAIPTNRSPSADSPGSRGSDREPAGMVAVELNTKGTPMPKKSKRTPIPIGQRIRKARIAAGLTQVELAAALGITQTHVSSIEVGRRKPFDGPVERLKAIAEAIGCDVATFIE